MNETTFTAFSYNRKVLLSYYKKNNVHNSFRIGARTMDTDFAMNFNSLTLEDVRYCSRIKCKCIKNKKIQIIPKKKKGGIILKRLVIFIMMVLIFAASIGVGFFYLNSRDDQKKESRVEANNTIKSSNEIVSTETLIEEKISPNAKLTETVFYKECGHEIIEIGSIKRDWINLTEEELKEKLEGYELEKFSEMEVFIYKEEEGICPEHYIIGESDGYVNIYKINQEGETELYETTSIYLEYLPEEEQNKLKEQIEVLGQEELNAVLENLES